MKRVMCLLLSMLLFLCGCSSKKYAQNKQETNQYIVGVWFSYTEVDNMLKGDFKKEFNNALQNCEQKQITDVFVHVRPFCDSIYKSQYFPLRDSVAAHNFDVLEFMVNACHQKGIRFHAWINPYRVRTVDNDVSALPQSSPVKSWLTDNDPVNDQNVSLLNGIYLNPASANVRGLVIDGVREIINNYEVDGIHFDDYFYPTIDPLFDEQLYAQYCENTNSLLPLDDFRRANVNALISGTYTAVKFKNKDIIFSVSPSASVGDNYSKHYADADAWCQYGCVDYIMPQLYFGFDYPDENFKFEKLIEDWKEVTKGTNTKLLIGLATYKIGTTNQPDSVEWAKGVEVINQQTEVCKTSSDVAGHVYFSYSSMVKELIK